MWQTRAVLIVCLAAHAAAHGGKLHPGSPEVDNYIRVKVASCSKWVSASGRIKAKGVVPSASKMEPVAVKGTVTLWQYLYGNCSYPGEDPSAGAAFNISITRGGKPLSNTSLDGLGMIGSCADNGVKPYYFNPDKKPVDDNENMLWFTNYTTKAEGKVVGNGANDGIIRTVKQGDKDAVKSMVLVETKTNSILSCCDLVTPGPASTNWTKALDGQGLTGCDENGVTPASKLTNSTSSSTGSMQDSHAGHNHGAHDHAGHNHGAHDHAGHNHTANGSMAASKPADSSSGGSKAKSGAVVVSTGTGLAVAAVLAAIVLVAL